MPQTYRFTNNQTGKSIEFQWSGATPPTEADIDAQFAAQDPRSDFDQRLKRVQDRMAALNEPVSVLSRDRDAAQQAKLYAQGRTTPGAIVTNADGVTNLSNHQKGTAADMQFSGTPDWETLGKIAKEEGLTWGGDWKSLVDKAHIELAQKQAAQEQGQAVAPVAHPSAPEPPKTAPVNAASLWDTVLGTDPLKQKLIAAGNKVITPLVSPETAAKVGGALGNYVPTPIKNSGLVDTLQGIGEGMEALNPLISGFNTLKNARAALGGLVEGAATQTDPLTIASTAVPLLKGVKAPATAVKLAKAGQAALGAGLTVGGVAQASDSDRSIASRLAGLGKAGLGVVGMAGALPEKAAVAQIQPGTVGMDQATADALSAARKAGAQTPAPTATTFDPGGAARQFAVRNLDSQTQLRSFIDQAKTGGAQIADTADPANFARKALGTGAQFRKIEYDINKIRDEANQQGLGAILTHYLDLHGMAHASEKMAGKSDAIWQALKTGQALPQGYTPNKVYGEIQNFMLNAPPDLVQKVEGMGDRVFSLLRSNLDELHNAGIVNDKSYQEWTKIGDNYIPQTKIINKSIEDHFNTFVGTLDPATQKVVKSITGSAKDTLDPLNAATALMQRSKLLLNQNEVTSSLRALADSGDPFLKANIIPITKGTKKIPEGFKTLHYWTDGVRNSFAVPAEVADAVTMASAQSMPIMFKDTMSKAMNVYRALATTLNPFFAASNILRDPQDARRLVQGAQQFIDPVNLLKGDLSNVASTGKFYAQFARELGTQMKSLAKGENLFEQPAYREMVDAGAGFSGMQSQIGLAPEYEGNPIFKGLAELSNRLEQTTKLASWKYLKNQGVGDMQSMLQTRAFGGSPDFAVKGTAGPAQNLLTMFFNAKMQGIARDLNWVVKNPQAAPGMAIRKLMGPVAATTLFSYWNNHYRDEDGNRTIDKINPNIKNNNYIVVTPFMQEGPDGKQEHFYVRFPMGHLGQFLNSIGELAGSASGVTNNTTVPQALADVASNVQPFAQSLSGKSVADFAKSAALGTAASLNPAIRVPLEAVTGYDTLRGIPIVPRRLQEVGAENQFDADTSPTAVSAANAFNELVGKNSSVKVSPMVLEHLIKSFPGLGEAGLSMADSIVGGEAGPQSRELMTADQRARAFPIFNQMYRRFAGVGGNQIKNDLYDQFLEKYGQANEASRAEPKVMQRGPDAYEKFLNDHAEEIASNPMLTEFNNNLAQIRNLKDYVRQNAADIPDAKATLQELESGERELLTNIVTGLGGQNPAERPGNKLGMRAQEVLAFMKKIGAQ